MVDSASQLDTSCTLSGSPSWLVPNRIDKPGSPVTFSGTVAPDKTGHVIYLQRQNANGNGFHTVQVERVQAGSTYSITRRLFEPGTKTFRVFIPGGPFNQGAASGPFTIQVAPASAQQVNGDQPNSGSAG